MDRITPKEVLSMMDAVAQVYEQPEVEQVNDYFLRTLKMQVEDYEETPEEKNAREATCKIQRRSKIRRLKVVKEERLPIVKETKCKMVLQTNKVKTNLDIRLYTSRN